MEVYVIGFRLRTMLPIPFLWKTLFVAGEKQTPQATRAIWTMGVVL
jgi:hypothetical protein